MATEAKMLIALDRAAAGLTGAKLRRASASSLCDQYKAVRKYIVLALPLIKKIPLIGAKIGVILEFLMKVADTVCPTL